MRAIKPSVCMSFVGYVLIIALLLGLMGGKAGASNLKNEDKGDELTVEQRNRTETDSAREKKRNLYYGYNVMGERDLCEPDAFGNVPIIDENSSYDAHINYRQGTKGEAEYLVKYSLRDLTEAYVASQKIGGNVSANFGKVFQANVGVEGQFDQSKRKGSICSEKYELYSYGINYNSYTVGLDLYQIRDYLAANFSKDLYAVKNEQDAMNLFKKYGTHLLTGIMLGGRLNVTSYMSTNDVSVDLSKRTSLKAKMEAANKAMEANVDASFVEQYESEENSSNSNSSYKFTCFGGEQPSALTLDNLLHYNASITGVDSAGFMYSIWVHSLNRGEKLAVVGIPQGSGAIPLWDLLDPSKNESAKIKDILLKVYVRMCGDKYDAYLRECNESMAVIDEEALDPLIPIFEGAYVKSDSGIVYYVDASDFEKGGAHFEIHQGDTLFLNLQDKGILQYDFERTNCELIDKEQGVFRVNAPQGTCSITIVNQDRKKTIISVPIVKNVFDGGTGTKEYPYLISNKGQFVKIADHLSSHFRLQADIDFGGDRLSCMGDFDGVLDGNYCTISNFVINSTKYWGLFRNNSGTIKDLHINNAGSSTSWMMFADGGLDYYHMYMNEAFENYSVKAESAGIICSRNTKDGTIENVCLDNVFIRNTIKNQEGFVYGGQFAMTVGGIAGKNEGNIVDSMVSNGCILAAFISDRSANDWSVNIYAGGIIGDASGGNIISCVYDSGSDGSIAAQLVLQTKENGGNKSYLLAGGLIGHCDSRINLHNCYSYIRQQRNGEVVYHAVDISPYIYYLKKKEKKERFDLCYAFSSGSVLATKESDFGSEDNYVFCADRNVHWECITPKKCGKKNDSNGFENHIGFQNKQVDSEGLFNELKLSKCFEFKKFVSGGVGHILQNKERSAYIDIFLEDGASTEFCEQQRYTFGGVKIKRSIGDYKTDDVKSFTAAVKKNAAITSLDNKLTSGAIWKVEFGVYKNNDVKPSTIELSVEKVKKIGLHIGECENSADGTYRIYLDQRDKVGPMWLENLNISFVMSNGTIERIDFDSNPELREHFEFKNVDDQISYGQNLIRVSYKSTTSFDSQFVLYADKRNIQSVEIIKEPVVKEYRVGSSIKDSMGLDGMEVRVCYDRGEDVILKDSSDLKSIEIIGDTISLGPNIITISYLDYSNTDTFTVEGIMAEETIVPVITPTAVPNNEGEIRPNSRGDAKKEAQKTSGVVWGIFVGIIGCAVIVMVVVFLLKRRKGKSK